MEHEGWQEGMPSSLSFRLAALRRMSADVDGIIFMVCDQPYVTKSLLNSFLQAPDETGLPIVAGIYEDKLGKPALFHNFFLN